MKKLYLFLAILGFVVPYYFFVSFLMENGLDVALLIDQLFANDISTFFAVDLIIAALAFMIFAYMESQRWQMGNWWVYVIATLAVGPSFAFPLFLYSRERRMETSNFSV